MAYNSNLNVQTLLQPLLELARSSQTTPLTAESSAKKKEKTKTTFKNKSPIKKTKKQLSKPKKRKITVQKRAPPKKEATATAVLSPDNFV